MPSSARTASGYHLYDEAALGQLGFVRAAQVLVLTPGEIRQIIAFRDDAAAPCAHVTELLSRRAADLDCRMPGCSSSATCYWPSPIGHHA